MFCSHVLLHMTGIARTSTRTNFKVSFRSFQKSVRGLQEPLMTLNATTTQREGDGHGCYGCRGLPRLPRLPRLSWLP